MSTDRHLPAIRILALVGPRAVGKSSLARALAGRLGWPMIDGDEQIAAEVGQSAGDYLAAAGEDSFRAVEQRLSCAALARPGHLVCALGGGAVLSESLRRALQSPEILVIHLTAPAECLVDRLRSSALNRPSLTGLPLAEEVAQLLQDRLPLYRQVADFELETFPTNVDACCERIIAKIH